MQNFNWGANISAPSLSGLSDSVASEIANIKENAKLLLYIDRR
jgi:hypothetical protein